MSDILGVEGWIPLFQSKTVGGLFEIHLNNMFFHKKTNAFLIPKVILYDFSNIISNKQQEKQWNYQVQPNQTAGVVSICDAEVLWFFFCDLQPRSASVFLLGGLYFAFHTER